MLTKPDAQLPTITPAGNCVDGALLVGASNVHFKIVVAGVATR